MLVSVLVPIPSICRSTCTPANALKLDPVPGQLGMIAAGGSYKHRSPSVLLRSPSLCSSSPPSCASAPPPASPKLLWSPSVSYGLLWSPFMLLWSSSMSSVPLRILCAPSVPLRVLPPPSVSPSVSSGFLRSPSVLLQSPLSWMCQDRERRKELVNMSFTGSYLF